MKVAGKSSRRDRAKIARYKVPGSGKKPLRPARDAAIVARYEVPGNEKKRLRPAGTAEMFRSLSGV